jgi:hypothetical protein
MSPYNYLGKCLVSESGSFGFGRFESVQFTVGLQEVSYKVCGCVPPFKLLKSAAMEKLISDSNLHQPTPSSSFSSLFIVV